MPSLCVAPEPSPRSCRPGRLARARRQRGATLIEVLVSVVLLSFGIVGLAGLQMNGTKFNHSAYLRSQATAMAYDMADRMRGNLDVCRFNAPAGCAYDTPRTTLFDGNAAQACGNALDLGPGATAAMLAAADVNQWKSCLEDALPEGRGAVQVLAAGALYTDQCNVGHVGSGAVVIEVNWSETRLGNPVARECVVLRTEVRPLP
ncbi:MAG TPA: type IV pilus modification protein PilV [Hydrogenophaga sp.]|uniref:type IV pilus modification protein PilV n=1 Tax=Hydrogenophaga sp. TaxID=1904254 RepID=UPI002C16A88C|nr:type IV pilus modification protein PilV [Hydrogenophaga sp.]HMN93009.1 type IV pilus modification protein PilV [Hydrogenophaga sp.]HMP10771.1 type IV pilus modification protein PilV [Hydrogenophaga sp.]